MDTAMTEMPVMKSLKGVMTIRSGGSDYFLNFSNIIWIQEEGGWFGVMLEELRNEKEVEQVDSLAPIERSEAGADMIRVEEAKDPGIKKQDTKNPEKKPVKKSPPALKP
jgi:hypothetical protein